MGNRWWKEAVIYQVYPRSFNDTNGDGIGDLKGVTVKLDYLKDLGISVIWLNPCYKSPNDDNGYDISDYKKIMDEFGTMEDYDQLLSEAHKRGIKLIMDLVVNHSSDEHEWFQESRKSKDNPYRDYYIWRAPKNGKEPNNWGSYFSPSAWEYDQATGEYYLHTFSKKQPDLNWENPKLRKAVYDIMNYWLNKGIDGFRMDVINVIKKPNGLPDSQLSQNEGYSFDPVLYSNNPGLVDFLQEMYRETLCKYDAMTVGETVEVTPQIALPYVQEGNNTLNMVFHFEMHSLDGEWTLGKIKDVQKRWIQGIVEKKGWMSQYLCNHDQARSVSVYGNDTEYREASAKLLATMLHTLPGTPYVYQGEEIGMSNCIFNSIDEFNDISARYKYNQLIQSGKTDEDALAFLNKTSREHSRTPMQWDGKINAGFTTGKPWLKINPNYKEINVKRALEDKNSVFYYYKELIALRKCNKVMVYGSYTPVLEEYEEIYAYIREYENIKWLVILNFSDKEQSVTLPQHIKILGAENIICNYGADFGRSFGKQKSQTVCCVSYEAIVMDISACK